MYGLVSSIASELPKLEPGKEQRTERLGYIYASDGKTVLAALRGSESRIIVGSDEISPVMKQAIVAVEDRRFWEHRASTSGAWPALCGRTRLAGSSGRLHDHAAVHQEPVHGAGADGQPKLKEAALAWQLEQRWSKRPILTAYLNTIYFGNGAYGIEMASRVYFDKHAGSSRSPRRPHPPACRRARGAYDPATNSKAAGTRRTTVLGLMLAQGLITEADYRTADESPLPRPAEIGLPGSGGA